MSLFARSSSRGGVAGYFSTLSCYNLRLIHVESAPKLTDVDNGINADQKTQLALETARIHWRELQPWFAKGDAIAVSASLDLVDVAYELCQDNKALFEVWIKSDYVAPVKDAQAEVWFAENKELWAVVVKPWVLVQDKPLG